MDEEQLPEVYTSKYVPRLGYPIVLVTSFPFTATQIRASARCRPVSRESRCRAAGGSSSQFGTYASSGHTLEVRVIEGHQLWRTLVARRITVLEVRPHLSRCSRGSHGDQPL